MTTTPSSERMKRKELSKLAYLAQEILDNPDGFEQAVDLVERSDTNGGISDEFRLVLDELRNFWASIGTSDWRVVAERAVDLDREGLSAPDGGRAKRLVGISLAWAAENKLWRIETGRPLSREENETLDLLAKSAANAPGL
jgi:hypothetical protein